MALHPLQPPDFADRVRRSVWNVVWVLLYRPSPNPLHGWRRFLLRAFGAKIGARAHPYPKARIWAPWNLEMEADSCLADAVDCYNVAPIVLRRSCIVSQKVYLCSGSHDITDPGFALIGDRIEIGAFAWVAADAFVGPGVTMGDRSIAAARAVVTRDVAAGKTVAGNPARVVFEAGRVTSEPAAVAVVTEAL